MYSSNQQIEFIHHLQVFSIVLGEPCDVRDLGKKANKKTETKRLGKVWPSLAVEKGEINQQQKLSCFNHFTSFYHIFLPNFCSLMIFFWKKTICAQVPQPTGKKNKTHTHTQKRRHDNVIVLDGPRLWSCAGLSLLSTCLALAWRLRWLCLRGGYEAIFFSKNQYFSAAI